MASGVPKNWRQYLSVGQLSANWVLNNFPFVLFMFFLTTLYIANAHYSDKKVRQIQGVQEEMQKMRWRFLSQKSKLMYDNKQSEVANEVDANGLLDPTAPPMKIVIPKKHWYN